MSITTLIAGACDALRALAASTVAAPAAGQQPCAIHYFGRPVKKPARRLKRPPARPKEKSLEHHKG